MQDKHGDDLFVSNILQSVAAHAFDYFKEPGQESSGRAPLSLGESDLTEPRC